MSPTSRTMRDRNQKGASALAQTIEKIKKDHDLIDNEDQSVVDIMTFCDSPKYLDLPGSNFHLWTSQRTVLKCLYMGTAGNENLRLDEDEIENKLAKRRIKRYVSKIEKFGDPYTDWIRKP